MTRLSTEMSPAPRVTTRTMSQAGLKHVGAIAPEKTVPPTERADLSALSRKVQFHLMVIHARQFEQIGHNMGQAVNLMIDVLEKL